MSDERTDPGVPEALRRFFGLLLEEYPTAKIREMAASALQANHDGDLSNHDNELCRKLAWDAHIWTREFSTPRQKLAAKDAELKDLAERVRELMRLRSAMRQMMNTWVEHAKEAGLEREP